MIDKFYGYIAGAVAFILTLAGFYLRGRSTGRADERQDRDAAVAKQQTEVRETVREVENEINQTDDAGVLDRASKWVRKPGSGRN